MKAVGGAYWCSMGDHSRRTRHQKRIGEQCWRGFVGLACLYVNEVTRCHQRRSREFFARPVAQERG